MEVTQNKMKAPTLQAGGTDIEWRTAKFKRQSAFHDNIKPLEFIKEIKSYSFIVALPAFNSLTESGVAKGEKVAKEELTNLTSKPYKVLKVNKQLKEEGINEGDWVILDTTTAPEVMFYYSNIQFMQISGHGIAFVLANGEEDRYKINKEFEYNNKFYSE